VYTIRRLIWLVSTVGGVLLVIAGVYSAAGGSLGGLWTVAAGIGCFIVGRILAPPPRPRNERGFRGSRRAARAAARKARTPASVGERSRRR
jgi:hypothetical protein